MMSGKEGEGDSGRLKLKKMSDYQCKEAKGLPNTKSS